MTQEDYTTTNNSNKSFDFLVTAFEFQLGPTVTPPPPSLNAPQDWDQQQQQQDDDDEDAWSGYDWQFSECGTPHPTPRPNYATLFVKYGTNITNHIDGGNDGSRINIVRGHSEQDDPETMEEDDDRIRIYSNSSFQESTVPLSSSSSTTAKDSSNYYFLRGVAYPQEDLVNIENVHDIITSEQPAKDDDAISWTMGIFHVASQRDYEFACQLAKEDSQGRIVLLKHEQSSRLLEQLKPPSSASSSQGEEQEAPSIITLEITTGMGPDDASTRPDSPRFWHQRLSTRIELLLKTTSTSTLIAKCHISYRDDQWDPWIGPCIEAMSVNPLYRGDGQGWLWILWHSGVVPFLQQHFGIVDGSRSDNNNNHAEPPSIQVRVIHLLGSELDRHHPGDNNNNNNNKPSSIWDKDFYFGQVGFSILPRGLRTGVMNFLRPQDDQGIGYIPLEEATSDKEGAVAKPKQAVAGARYCQTCGKISRDCFACPNACGGRVYYCSETCQEQDAPQHNVWCGLTRAELHEVLVQKGRRVQDSNSGVWKTVL